VAATSSKTGATIIFASGKYANESLQVHAAFGRLFLLVDLRKNAEIFRKKKSAGEFHPQTVSGSFIPLGTW
jgi:hypothetical protein